LQSIFTAIKNAVEVQCKGFVPAFQGTGVNRSITPFASAAAGDVDEDVKASMLVYHILNSGFNFGRRSDIYTERIFVG
jgi:hypothetical protein